MLTMFATLINTSIATTCIHCFHFRITNITIENQNNEVLARSYVDAILTPVHSGVTHRAEGYYDDALVRTSDGWKIARRRFTLVKASLDE